MTPDPAAVPDGWQAVRLGDVSSIRREQVRPTGGDSRPYVALEHIDSAGSLNGYGTASDSISNKTVFRKGDTLYGKLRPNLRKVIRAEVDGVCSTDILAVFAREGADGPFLSQLLRSDLLHAHAMRGVAGTKMPRTSWNHLRTFTLPIPPLAEQRAIAAVLDAIDEAIERTEEVIAATERLRDALLHELLTRGLPGRHSEWADVRGLGTVPACWVVVRLGDVAKFRSGFGARSSELQPRSEAFPFPVYGGNGVAGYWPEPLVEHQVVVIGRVGQKCGVVQVTDGPAWITDNALYNEWLAARVTTDFLALVTARARLNDIRNRNDLPLVTQQIVHSVPVALPSPTEQRTIVTVLDGVDAAIKEARAGRARLQSLQASAADALLTGRVRVGASGHVA